MNIRRSILTAGVAVALATPVMANAMVVDGAGVAATTHHANTVRSKHSGKAARMVGSFANIPGFNVAVQSSIGYSKPR